MTSFTRKLHELDPHAAQQIRRQNYLDYRYGKNVTLAEFTPELHRPFRGQSETQLSYGHRAGLAAPSFGQRLTPPPLPAYECWAPGNGESGSAKPKAIVHSADSFAARKVYASHHQISVVEVAARRR